MKPLNQSTLADLTIQISWNKDGIHHYEHYLAKDFNFYRDIFPGTVLESRLSPWKETFTLWDDAPLPRDNPPSLWNEDLFSRDGEKTIHFTAKPGELVPPFDEKRVVTLPKRCIQSNGFTKALVAGGFYPSGIFSGVSGIFKGNPTPCRVMDLTKDRITVDFNHPLAKTPLDIHLSLLNASPGRREERGGSCTDWFDLALEGPGLQTASYLDHWRDPNTLGLDDKALNRVFKRADETPDAQFYETDRFVHHIDTTASRHLSCIYEKLLSKNDGVLDLMSGWVSHLPETIPFAEVTGLGMNRNEMENNPQLTGSVVHDLNLEPILPFESHRFDQVICSLSVEYLTQPLAVFNEVARVLKPGGRFTVGFSNRWFPEKAIASWKDLHDFERIGLVLDFFRTSHRFQGMETYSVRGYPRPSEDKYAHQLALSDPIYVVTGIVAD